MRKLQAELPVEQFLRECVDVPRFLEQCRACPNYEKVWSCPPFSFKPEELWGNYDSILLLGRVIETPETMREVRFSSSQALGEAGRALLRQDKREMLLELLEMEKQTPGSRALSAGSCDFCADCGRVRGEECRNPGVMRYSLETLGADVGKALELYFDQKLLWGWEGQLPEYFILLGGLLKKKPVRLEKKEMGYRVW